MIKKIIIFLILTCPVSSLQAQSLTSRLDSLLLSYAADGSFNGTALVALHGKVLLEKGYGFRNVKDSARNDANTIFQIASITKQFTATVILRLAEQGKLSLTDPLTKYYPTFPNGQAITIENLLTHTSGIVDIPGLPAAADEDRFMAVLMKTKPASPPGEKMEYSNPGYFLLGYIIEKVTGMSYYQAVKNYIFKPLHMNHSGFDMTKLPFDDKALGYTVYTSDTKTEAEPVDPKYPFSAGAMCSTVRDLYKWHRALQSYRIVSKVSLEKAYTEHLGHYGYGWYTDSVPGKKIVLHDGGIPGFSNFIFRIPQDDVCIILLNNKEGKKLYRICRKINALLGEEKQTN